MGILKNILNWFPLCRASWYNALNRISSMVDGGVVMYSACDVAKWFLVENRIHMAMEDADYITNLKLQKLLYYAQGCYLAIKNIKLFPENLLAWEHGPVVREVYDEYKQYGSKGIPDDNFDYDFNLIDEETQSILRGVYNEFGRYSAWGLRELSHSDAPWQNTPKNSIISTDAIKDYFLDNYIDDIYEQEEKA